MADFTRFLVPKWRPMRYVLAMSAPPLFIIIGAPAAGKSSTGRAVAERFPRSLHIPVDDLRDMVRSGLSLPSPEWQPEFRRQLSLARLSAVDMARRYRRAGFTVVVDDFIDPGGLAEYNQAFAKGRVVKICLRPDRAAAVARNAARATNDDERAYLEEGIMVTYAEIEAQAAQLESDGWVFVDNTHLAIEETAEKITAMV